MAYQDDVNDINSQADYARKKAAGAETANLQGQKQALARRAAQLGNAGPSGAFIKQEQIAGDQSAHRLADVNEGIDQGVRGQVMQARQAEDQRKFQTSERLGGQDFAAGQAELGRQFQTSERLGSQDFSHGERLGSQDFAAGQAALAGKLQKELQTSNQAFTTRQNEASLKQSQNQFIAQMDRDSEKFAHEKEVDAFNMKLSNKMANQKGPLDQLFGNFSSENLGKLF